MAPTASVATSRIVVAWRTLKILRKNLAQNGSHFSTDPESRAEFDVNSTRFVETQNPEKIFFETLKIPDLYHIIITSKLSRNTTRQMTEMTETYATLLYGNKTAAINTMLYSLRTFDKKRTVVIMTLEHNLEFPKLNRFAPIHEIRVSRLQGNCNVHKFARAPYIRKRIERLFYFSCIQLDKILTSSG